MKLRPPLLTAAWLTFPLVIVGHLAFATFWVVALVVTSLTKGGGFDSAITASAGYLFIHFIAFSLGFPFFFLMPAGFVFLQSWIALLLRQLPLPWFFGANLAIGAGLGVACSLAIGITKALTATYTTRFNLDESLSHPFALFFGSIGLFLGLVLSFLIQRLREKPRVELTPVTNPTP